MNKSIRLGSFALLIATGLVPRACAQASKLNANSIELCDFKVRPVLANANASFSMIFRLRVDDRGVPTDIEMVEGHFLDKQLFIDCLKRWRLAAPADEKVFVEFDWIHAKGWARVTVTGATIALKLTIQPGACGVSEW